MTDDAKFDCFLSHNSNDKHTARAIKSLLAQRGLAAWIDEDELPPGTKWQNGLEEAIKVCRSVAVLMGPFGEGPWQSEEAQAALDLAAHEKVRVFAVLLPGLKDSNDLSIFLRNRVYVDFRRGLNDPISVSKMLWGITGHKPTADFERPEGENSGVAYAEDRLSLNFQDIEVRAVLQLLADFAGLNMVASDTVRGNVTVRLKNIPWDHALDIILKSKGLSLRQAGDVLLVAPTQEIAAQEKLDLEYQMLIEELEPLHITFFRILHARASDIASILCTPQSKFLSERGTINVDERTNTLVARETTTGISLIRRFIDELDVPLPSSGNE